MPVCQIQANGWCDRHQTQHEGRLRELALDPGPKGEQYRKLWDIELAESRGNARVGMLTKAINFTQAIAKVAAHTVQGRPIAASAEVIKMRLEICAGTPAVEKCPHYLVEEKECNHPNCGCRVQAKVYLEASSCPIGKW